MEPEDDREPHEIHDSAIAEIIERLETKFDKLFSPWECRMIGVNVYRSPDNPKMRMCSVVSLTQDRDENAFSLLMGAISQLLPEPLSYQHHTELVQELCETIVAAYETAQKESAHAH